MKRLNLIALGIFVLLVLAVFQFRPETTKKIQSSALTVFGSAHEAVHDLTTNSDVIDGVDISPQALAEKYSEEELYQKYSRLLREVGELRRIRSQFDTVQEENGKLRQALNFKKSYTLRDRMVASRVVKRDASTFWNTMDIDKGSEDGILPDSSVLSYSGSLVGKVIRVSKGNATVLLLTDEQCQVTAKVEGTLEQGIIMGTRTTLGQETPELHLKYLSKNASFQLDPKLPDAFPPVFSTGIPAEDNSTLGVFPSGLHIGTVRSFVKRELYGEAIITPAVDFSSITDVFVVLPRSESAITGEPSEIPAAVPVDESGIPSAIPVEDAIPSAVPVEATPEGDPSLDDIPTARPVTPDGTPIDPSTLD